jgi:hypothetical protein
LLYKKFWEELIAYFPLIRHGTHRKRPVQKFLYCLLYIRYRSNVFTESLHSNDRRIHTQTQRQMGGISEVRRRDGLRYHDIQIKFHKDCFSHSNVDSGYTQTQTAWGSHMPTFIFFLNKGSKLIEKNDSELYNMLLPLRYDRFRMVWVPCQALHRLCKMAHSFVSVTYHSALTTINFSLLLITIRRTLKTGNTFKNKKRSNRERGHKF